MLNDFFVRFCIVLFCCSSTFLVIENQNVLLEISVSSFSLLLFAWCVWLFLLFFFFFVCCFVLITIIIIIMIILLLLLLFMAPHLVRAQSAYKEIMIHSFHHAPPPHTHTPRRTRARAHIHTHIHTHTHTHTHYKYMHYWWRIGKTTFKYEEEKRWVFSFYWKEESEDECLTERGIDCQSTGPMYWKDLSAHPRNTEDASIREDSEKESRDEVIQRGMEEPYQKQCGWELFCIESGYWLVASGDRIEKEWCGQI